MSMGLNIAEKAFNIPDSVLVPLAPLWNLRKAPLDMYRSGEAGTLRNLKPMLEQIDDNVNKIDLLIRRITSLEETIALMVKAVKSLEVLTSIINPNIKITKKEYEVEEYTTSNDGTVTSTGKKKVQEYEKVKVGGDKEEENSSNSNSVKQKLQININTNNGQIPVMDYQKKK